jgi:hypothetical protein
MRLSRSRTRSSVSTCAPIRQCRTPTQIASRRLSGPAIGDNLERDLLPLVEAVHLDAPLADIERRFVLVLIEIAANAKSLTPLSRRVIVLTSPPCLLRPVRTFAVQNPLKS